MGLHDVACQVEEEHEKIKNSATVTAGDEQPPCNDQDSSSASAKSGLLNPHACMYTWLYRLYNYYRE